MKIVLACGGTGGHIFPAFSVAEEIKKRDPSNEILYVCGKKDIESRIFRMVEGEKIVPIDSAPFGSAAGPFFLPRLIGGFFQSMKFLLDEKPDAVVGFGGHFSFPVVLAARCLGIRTRIHEQNVVPGAANRALARLADGVALSFRETEAYLPPHRNRRVTGNPIRSSLERDCRRESLDFFGFSETKVTVLALGGSQGAESINTLFLSALPILPDPLKRRIQVLHLCGRMPEALAEARVRRMGIDAKAYSFFERMDLAYGACDFAVGRAGATFLAEISAKRIPAILIPYPFGDGHQSVNAELFCRSREGVVTEQKTLTTEKLARLLEEFIEKAFGKKNTVDREISPAPGHSRELLADFILEKSEARR